MIVVQEFMNTMAAAKLLGITPSRVRSMIVCGTIKAQKLGREWAIEKRDVEKRLREKPQPGRPRRKTAMSEQQNSSAASNTALTCQAADCTTTSQKDKERQEQAADQQYQALFGLYQLYKATQKHLPGSYQADVLLKAKSDEERHFYTTMADFFLQQSQHQLIRDGVF